MKFKSGDFIKYGPIYYRIIDKVKYDGHTLYDVYDLFNGSKWTHSDLFIEKEFKLMDEKEIKKWKSKLL